MHPDTSFYMQKKTLKNICRDHYKESRMSTLKYFFFAALTIKGTPHYDLVHTIAYTYLWLNQHITDKRVSAKKFP